jgi:hypothetical protein
MEKTRTADAGRNRRDDGSRGAPAPAAAPAAATYHPDVRVIYGAGVQSMPLVGLSVAQARDAAVAILGVDRRAPALVNGRPARADYRVVPGDELEFVHHAGEKG